MTATTHQAFGWLFGLITFSFLLMIEIIPNDIVGVVLFFLSVMVGSLLPDIDHPRSKIGSKFPFVLIAYPLYLLFGHRQGTHSPLFVMMIAFISFSTYWLFNDTAYASYLLWMAIGATVGTLSHVVGDGFFDGGVPLLYPISKKKYRMFIITCKTNSINELLVFAVILGLDILLIYQFVQNGTINIFT